MKYLKSHPWITFRLDLTKLNWVSWVRLGEAASKCVHLTKVPLQPETREAIHSLYLAKGAAATTAIEGNTLSEEQVIEHLKGSLVVPPSQEYLTREVDNVIGASNQILSELAASNELEELTVERICRYNLEIREGLPEDSDLAAPGELRTGSVIVGSVYRGAPAEDCRYLLEQLCSWLKNDFSEHEGYVLPFAILKAAMAHLYLAWIHPFDDGNGRTARLLELHILLSAGVPAPAVHLLSNHYNATRSEYARQLAYASKSGGDVLPFINYAIGGFVDGLREQLEYVWGQQWDVAWQHHVHETFRGDDGKKETRQRRLALDLGRHREWVQIDKIDEVNVRQAKAYATLSDRTVLRDLDDLVQKKLVVIESGKVRANRELIHALRPTCKIA